MYANIATVTCVLFSKQLTHFFHYIYALVYLTYLHIPLKFFTHIESLTLHTVGKKSIRALEIFRVQKLILNATS